MKLPGGYALQPGAPKPLPTIVISQEQYNRVMHLLDRGVNVEMEIDVVYADNDVYDYNVIGKITGTDLKGKVVLIGSHYDGKFGGTTATDNG